MNYKKLLVLLLCVSLTLSMTACTEEFEEWLEEDEYDYDDSDRSWLYDDDEYEEDDSDIEVSETQHTNKKDDGNYGDSFTLMIYMCGSDLESDYGCATSDINEILYADYSDDLNIIIETGGTKSWQNSYIKDKAIQRYKVENNGLELLEDIGKGQFLSSSNLSDFIKNSMEEYPADRYGLILWNHGGGTIGGYGVDDSRPNDSSMSLYDVAKALKDADCYFSFIGYDACLMATIENAYSLKDYADYLLASEESEPGSGWYYTNFISELADNPGISIPNLSETIISDFIDEDNTDVSSGVTLSLIDLKEIDNVMDSLMAYMNASQESIQDNGYSDISSARSNCRSYGDDDFEQIDIVDMAERSNVNGSKQLISAIDKAIISNGNNLKGSNGLAMYYPYYYPENYDEIMQMLSKIGFSDNDYEEYYNDFVSMMVTGQYNGGGSSNPFGYNEDELDWNEFTDYDWFNEDVVDYQDEYSYVNTDDLTLDDKGDYYALSMSDEDWDLVTTIWKQIYWDDGEGYMELGYDDYYEFDDDGDLKADYDFVWYEIGGCIVPYYAESEGEFSDGTGYSVAYVPAVLNDEEDIELVVYWIEGEDDPYIPGYRYPNDGIGSMGTKQYMQLEKGDFLDFYFDYYTYDDEFEASYKLEDNTYYFNDDLELSYYDLEGESIELCFYLQDIYLNDYWTEIVVY